MKCYLCHQNVATLEKSHIIPECLYEDIYDDKHRFIPIASDNYRQLKIEQLGYREELLCKSCEGKLSKWENTTKKDLVDISQRKNKFLTINELSDKFIIIENINHDNFKKCMLSILWRMSISKLEMFNAYSLGPYEEAIRKILNENSALSTYDFPLMIQELIINGKHHPDLIMSFPKGRVFNKYIQQSFTVYGYLIDIIISKHKFPQNYELLLLTDTGRMTLMKMKFSNQHLKHGLLSRLNDEDVRRFYKNVT